MVPWRPVTGVLLTVAAAGMLGALELSKHQTQVARGVVELTNEGFPAAYERPIERILLTARDGYQKLFGLDTPSPLHLRLRLDPHGGRRLFNDGAASIHWEITDARQLGPPQTSGAHNVYGLCHELGHLTMYPHLQTTQGLPAGIGEGWAHYVGSAVTGFVSEELGGSIWPEPHDYSRTSGPQRFRAQMEQVSGFSSPDLQAAKVFYDVEQAYGRRLLGQAMKQALAARPGGAELMPAFRDALSAVTKDPEAKTLVPEEFLEARLEWVGAKPKPADPATFEGLKVEADGGGLLLRYDDGAADGQLSTTGSGHAVLFARPPGAWRLDRVDVFSARYGDPEPPGKQCIAYVCDPEMKPIRDVQVPYALFGWGEMRWTSIRLPAVEVPRAFFVCLSFEPTAEVGVFVGTDRNVTTVHSYHALPQSQCGKLEDQGDWMIRVHLATDDPALGARAAEIVRDWRP